MFNPFERLVAMRYLRARRREGFISVIAGFSLLGIGLGVATLIIVMSVMNGFREELLSRILGVGGHIDVYGAGAPLQRFDDLADRLRQIKGVVSVIPVVDGQVMASANNQASGAVVRGVRREDLANRAVIADNIKMGSLNAFVGDNAVLIGTRMAQRLGLMVGDSITLISPKGNVTAFGTVPRLRAYKIAGIFEVGMFEYDNSFIYMPMEAAQTFFQLTESVSMLEMTLNDPYMVNSLRPEIGKVVGQGGRLLDWQQINSSFFTAIQVERNVMFLILTLIILVAAFNVISGMIMLVKDKGQDIAILRTMGATRGMIMRIFFLSGASVGVFGTLFGFVLGLLFCDNIESIRQFIQHLTGTNLFSAEIYFLSQLPAKVDPGEVATVVIMSLTLSVLATLYPSWRAARLDPVEALRYE
jgi:lipoprotein-releasing system permease protein